MHVHEHATGDVERLRALIKGEKDAEQRDRLLAALHALSGREAAEIAAALCRGRRFVQRWAHAYRAGGIDAVAAKPRGGDTPKIHGEHARLLKERIDAGPREGDGVCTLRGKDIQRIAREELGVDAGLSSVYRAMHRMGYSCLAPRPRHEEQDPAAQAKFKHESAPLL